MLLEHIKQTLTNLLDFKKEKHKKANLKTDLKC